LLPFQQLVLGLELEAMLEAEPLPAVKAREAVEDMEVEEAPLMKAQALI
jgi:hypothetical protein